MKRSAGADIGNRAGCMQKHRVRNRVFATDEDQMTLWLAGVLIGMGTLLHGCDNRPAEHRSNDSSGGRHPAIAETVGDNGAVSDIFEDITDAAGLWFQYDMGRDGTYFVPETIGGGAAVFDYDNDGDLDIFLVNGGGTGRARRVTSAPGSPENPSYFRNAGYHFEIAASAAKSNKGLFFFATQHRLQPYSVNEAEIGPGRARLFQQQRDGSFVDVTDPAGLRNLEYGMGCAVGDIDNDGDRDLLVTHYGGLRLWRNNGDGTFTDDSSALPAVPARWSCSAIFFDFDVDGFLDLYVTNYLVYDTDKHCTDGAGRPDYCGPNAFPDPPDFLFRNEGGRRFTDVSASSGIASKRASGLGVVALDANEDGLPDVYVANDADPNFLWINRGDGTFVDEAVRRGCAVNRNGLAESGMGIAIGDADGDGRLDLFVTNLIDETNTLYRNAGEGYFEDITPRSGLGPPSLPYTGFGAALFDFDNDGDLDIAVVNGAVKRRPAALRSGGDFWDAYVEPSLLFENLGGGRFANVARAAGAFTAPLELRRGLIPADLDGDGRLDLLVTSLDAPTRLYRNIVRGGQRGIRIRAVDPALRRDAVGAELSVQTTRKTAVFRVGDFGGYLTSGEAWVHFTPTTDEAIREITVRWPGGQREKFYNPAAENQILLLRGTGSSASE